MNIRDEPSMSLESRIHRARSMLKDDEVAGALGVDSTTVGRYYGGDTGIKLTKLEAFLRAHGMVVVSAKYLGAVTTLCEVGASCHCARSGLGECGR